MLTPPAIADQEIATLLRDHYGLCDVRIAFMPIGDAGSAHFRVDTPSGVPYFLKLRRDLDEVAVAVPAALHAQGIQHVMAPIATTGRGLWVSGADFAWILYPFVAGRNGFDAPLTAAQWRTLGKTMRAVHAAQLPAAIGETVPREDYAPRWRDRVRAYQQQVEVVPYDDPIAQTLAAFWSERRGEITLMVERAEQLGQALRRRSAGYVLCHADLHAGNVLLGEHDELTIVDWDNPIQAPRERDLMFVGGGVGAIWNTAEEEALFYAGYGATERDTVALSYYRYERIVEDLAVYGDQIFGVQGSVEDRTKGLRVREQFLPGSVVQIAHRTFERLR